MSIDDTPPSAGTPLVVCAVCARVLSYDGTAGGYAHSFQDRDTDHPAVATYARDLPTHHARCDFCNADVAHDAVWTVPARDFCHPQILGAPPEVSVGDWAACIGCVELVRSNRWDQLVERVVRLSPSLSNVASLQQRAWLVALYRKLAEHMTGEPYRGPTRRIQA
jgi:hypothetical protein